MKPKRVLFLCTGNYYRSRFAEYLFNHLATQVKSTWVADSCGLHVQVDGIVNVGPMSIFAAQGLAERQIPVAYPHTTRHPRQVSTSDLQNADLVVAIKEAEHRPLMQSLHPDHVDRIRYWHVHDLDMALPQAALAELEQLVTELFRELNE